MSYILITALVCMLVGIAIVIGYKCWQRETHMSSLPVALLSVFLGLVIGLVVDTVVAEMAEREFTQVYVRELKGLPNEQFPDAPFVMGVGDGDTNYYYMLKAKGEPWKMSAMKASMVTIVEINEGTPRIVKESDRVKDEEIRRKTFMDVSSERYTMYVPAGFVTTKYPIEQAPAPIQEETEATK